MIKAEDIDYGIWLKGYATEISQSILEYAFGKLGESEVIASTHIDNHTSIRVLEKLGFSLQKTEAQSNQYKLTRL